MPITFDEKRKLFRLVGKGFLYSFFINDEGIAVHLHYGAVCDDDFLSHSLIDGEWSSHYLSEDGEEKEYSSGFPFNVGLFEVPPFGKADHRPAALVADDCRAIDLRYVGHRIYEGKPEGDEYPTTAGPSTSAMSGTGYTKASPRATNTQDSAATAPAKALSLFLPIRKPASR